MPIIVAIVTAGIVYCGIYLALLLVLRTFREEDFRLMEAVEKKLGLNLNWIKKVVKSFY